MNRSDQQLIADYLAGEENAFAILTNRYLPAVYSFARRLTDSDHDASDIVQETFLRIWRNLKKYQPDQSFKTWLFTITHHAAIDLLRKRKDPALSSWDREDGGNPLTDSLTDSEPLPDDLFERQELGQALEQALAKISPDRRTILLLHPEDELTFEEISKIVGRPVNTVKSQYRRSLSALKAILTAPK